ncbi:lipase family protein [Chitinophaga pinensis]|uniref:Lipase family protein n=1 Tax=Chitinophaga pinensis TaxID=79329 RepID=A0A5C6LWM9_9BACT|nr:lipase family protein [Chitinophaga pinensis]
MANVFTSFFLSLGQRLLPSSNISLYTFAAPAAGNSAFAIALDRKLPNAWHYHNANDLVPDFPTFDGLVYSSLLYNPSPSAGAITTTYKGHTVSLRRPSSCWQVYLICTIISNLLITTRSLAQNCILNIKTTLLAIGLCRQVLNTRSTITLIISVYNCQQ